MDWQLDKIYADEANELHVYPVDFYLLGHKDSHQSIRQPLGLKYRKFAYIAHSATFKDYSSANFGFIRNDESHCVGKLFNRVSIINSEQGHREANKKEAESIKTMLHRMLSHRQI